jgi:hypothetical protein
LPQVRLRPFFKQSSHGCAKLEKEMRFLLLLVPVGIYFVSHSSLWGILRGLPKNNSDFGENY